MKFTIRDFIKNNLKLSLKQVKKPDSLQDIALKKMTFTLSKETVNKPFSLYFEVSMHTLFMCFLALFD